MSVVRQLDLPAYSEAPTGRPIHLLFIHHSCGGHLFASPGDRDGANCIYRTHPQGGGLRSSLEKCSYHVHEASYGSRLGERTDIFDWPPKFRTQMEQVLKCDFQDTYLRDGLRNQLVLFKSCFPNNQFTSSGAAPGDPAGPELTVWNAKAAYTALLDDFRKQPDVLFVCMTAPPLAAAPPKPLWKQFAGKFFGRAGSPEAAAPLARQFNNWLAAQDGWLKDYSLKNVVVFDLYDILTGFGKSDLSFYPTAGGYDSHPSREGNERAAEAFVPFLNQAVRRLRLEQRTLSATAGISEIISEVKPSSTRLNEPHQRTARIHHQ